MGFLRRPAVFGLVVFALAFGSLWLWRLRYTPEAALAEDSTWYFDAARAIEEGRESRYLSSSGKGSFLDVGYPHLLAAWFRVTGVSVVAGQALNGVFWGLTCLFVFLTSRYWLDDRWAARFGGLVAFAPALSSFGPKLYSEHAAIAGGALALWAWYGFRTAASHSGRIIFGFAFALGMAVLVLTKSAFFPLLVILVVLAWIRRMPAVAVSLSALLLIAWPIHREVERAGRGRVTAAGQVMRLEMWPTSVALRCGAYSLSWNLGRKVFPEVEGACEPFFPRPGQPMAELNTNPWLKPDVRKNFTYSDALRAMVRRPFKYALICGVNLLGAVWAEGVYPVAVEGLGPVPRTVLWLFKVALSSALWIVSLLVVWRSLRQAELRAVACPLLFGLAYILLVQMNVLGEVRYFFPVLPLQYLLVSQWFWWQSRKEAEEPAVSGSGAPSGMNP